MFRVFSILSAIFLGARARRRNARDGHQTITKAVTVKVPGRTCRIETRQVTSAEFCATELNCSAIKTCAEAYYRLTACGHRWLDGGTAVRSDGEPNRRGEPDGIPCEKELRGSGGADDGRQDLTLPMARHQSLRSR